MYISIVEAFQSFEKAYAKKETAPYKKHYYEAAQAAYEEFFVSTKKAYTKKTAPYKSIIMKLLRQLTRSSLFQQTN